MKWQQDKLKHFFVGMAAGIVLQSTSLYIFPSSHLASAIAAFIALIAICYGFELLSLVTGKGHYEIMDAVAGIMGGIIGMAMIGFIILI